MHRNLSHSMLCCRHSRIYLRNPRRITTTITTTTTSRLASSVSRPTFTSFFFHNAQWTSSSTSSTTSVPNGKATKFSRTSISDLAHRAIPVPDPSIPLSAYKEIEKPTGMKLFKIYNQLAKSNLTILVVLTSMSGVALSPFPTTLPILLSTALGTVLCSASANTLNQLQEVPFDAQMARTRMRPLVRRAVTPLHALGFAVVTGVAGPALLCTMTNPTTACLGLANIILYAGVYTWMKRRSVWNTWVGSVVGGIPPLMGWTACGGRLLPDSFSMDSFPVFLPPFLTDGTIPAQVMDLTTLDNVLAPVAFFMFLFSWQFLHFNPLSHFVRHSYAQAGYQMLAVLNPHKNALVALRHTALMIPICSLLFPLSGLTTWMFAVTSLVPNMVCLRAAWHFYRKGGEKEAKTLFHHSLWYLPVVMGLMMFHKQGMEWLEWLGLKEKTEQEAPVEDALT